MKYKRAKTIIALVIVASISFMGINAIEHNNIKRNNEFREAQKLWMEPDPDIEKSIKGYIDDIDWAGYVDQFLEGITHPGITYSQFKEYFGLDDWGKENIMQAAIVLVLLAVLYAATGYLIYGVQYVVAIFKDIQFMSLDKAFEIGDKILIALLITTVIAAILNHFKLIDISSLRSTKGGRRWKKKQRIIWLMVSWKLKA